jgi:hypothetical protein
MDGGVVLHVLRCAIEEIAEWHPQLFLEPHIVGSVAIMSRHSVSPVLFDVECENVESPWLRGADRFRLEVAWSKETANRAGRLRLTMQSKPLVEIAAIAIAMILVHRVVALGPLDVTEYGERADYRSLSVPCVLEISGTERLSEYRRRYRQKVAQALANPFGWNAYVVVCAFSPRGHRIHFSGLRWEELEHGQED